MTKAYRPRSAFLAITLLCNSRCVMCDIWKNKGMDFLPLEVYKRLPDSLEMIDITGGEPFLRPDIPAIVGVLRDTCPKARLLITTNGFLPDKIKTQIAFIRQEDPNIAFRVSLDGWGNTHEKIRRIPQAFEKVIRTLTILKEAGVKDLGVIYTLMKQNKHQLKTVYSYCKQNNLNFSLNVVHDSPVYFGENKTSLRPDPKDVKEEFNYVFWNQLKSTNPKNWAKAWFNKYSYYYMQNHRRPLVCGAGENFFYMDPFANIFMCHLKNWPIGNLKNQPFDQIWEGKAKEHFLPMAQKCHDCWIICTAKDEIKNNKTRIMLEIPRMLIEQARSS